MNRVVIKHLLSCDVDVAQYARKILEGDKAGRRGLYKKLGLPEDASVK